MATPPTDDQWAAMSKLLQSLIQRSDTGTYYSFMHAVRQLLPEINTPDCTNKTMIRMRFGGCVSILHFCVCRPVVLGSILFFQNKMFKARQFVSIDYLFSHRPSFRGSINICLSFFFFSPLNNRKKNLFEYPSIGRVWDYSITLH